MDLKKAVAETLGKEATVRTMARRIVLAIRDLDEATSEAEVVKAIQATVEDANIESITIKSMTKSFGGTQTAVVMVPAEMADRLLKAGKIKLGWMMCRVRERIQVVRCFRCLGFGHVALDCPSEDRSNICRLCGKEGHHAKECKEDPFCVVCSQSKEPGGALHILGSNKCESFQKELKKVRK